MEERLELAVGAVLATLAVLAGLAFWARPETGAAAAAVGRAVEVGLAPVNATSLEGVPDFGRAATAEELAILAPLGRGAVLGGWTIEQIDGVENGVMTVHVALHGSRMNVVIASSTGNTLAPPLVVGAYALFQTNIYGDEASGEAATMIAQTLSNILTTNAAVPVPAGLGPYIPDVASDPAVP